MSYLLTVNYRYYSAKPDWIGLKYELYKETFVYKHTSDNLDVAIMINPDSINKLIGRNNIIIESITNVKLS